jgi:excisionase family DNA binding protein
MPVKTKHLMATKNGTPAVPSDVLTLQEAASWLRVKPDQLHLMATEGQIPARKIGQDWRFASTALHDWLSHQGSFATRPILMPKWSPETEREAEQFIAEMRRKRNESR